MLIKFIGIFLLLTATLYLSVSIARSYRQRTRQTEGILLLLRHIRAKISCFSTPMSEIFEDFDNSELERTGFLSLARDKGLSSAVEESLRLGYFTYEQADMLMAMWNQLGDGYVDNAVGVCDYYISQFENVLSHEREEHPKMARIARGVVLTGGLMLIIVLL